MSTPLPTWLAVEPLDDATDTGIYVVRVEGDPVLWLTETAASQLANRLLSLLPEDEPEPEPVPDDDGWDYDEPVGLPEPEDDVSRCPACGDPIDYCQGHGAIADPSGWDVLCRHYAEDHRHCDPAGCADAGSSLFLTDHLPPVGGW